VYNIYVFGGKTNAAAMYARAKGFVPVSYWITATSFPLWYRSLAGLYNTACGYLGTAPWSYADDVDTSLYDADRTVHRVSYPDQSLAPIPTLAWEAYRDGIDDVRFLQALDRAIARADARLHRPDPPTGLATALAEAVQVRNAQYDAIEGRWFEYLCRLHPGDLSATRRALADATAGITRIIGPTGDEHPRGTVCGFR
jgi:hypothetical protein